MDNFMVFLSEDVEIKKDGNVLFNEIITNTDRVYDILTGEYKCKSAGVYMLTFSTDNTEKHNNGPSVELYVNEKPITQADTELIDNGRNCCTAVLPLQVDDRVCVRITKPGHPAEKKWLRLATLSGIYLHPSDQKADTLNAPEVDETV